MATRRQFLRGLGLWLLAGVAWGCAPERAAAPKPAEQPTRPAPTATLIYNVPLPPKPTATKGSTPQAQITAQPAVPGVAKLTILHTNDSRGYVDPCG